MIMATERKQELHAEPTKTITKSLKVKPLAQPITADEIANLLKAAQSDENGNLQKIIITQDVFKKIKESLVATIESMGNNKSLISQAAEFWGELPLWQKILGGTALTVPTLILGIIANIGFLLALCGVTAVVYTGGGIILSDHHQCNISITESLAKGIIGLADLLELTITALDTIRQKLAEEVAKFAAENEKLAENVGLLSTKVEELSIEIEASAKLAQSLKETKDALDKTVKELETQAIKQDELLNTHQKELEKLNGEYSDCQVKMAANVVEFDRIKNGLEGELSNAKKMADYFNDLSQEMGKMLLKGNEHQEQYIARLTEVLDNEKANYAILAERWDAADAKFQHAQDELARTNEAHKAIVETQKIYTDRLETIAFTIAGSFSPKVREALKQVGFFTKGSPKDAKEKEILDKAITSFLGELANPEEDQNEIHSSTMAHT